MDLGVRRPITHESWKMRAAPLAMILCSAGPEGLEMKELLQLAHTAGMKTKIIRECLAWLEHHGMAFYRPWNKRWVHGARG